MRITALEVKPWTLPLRSPFVIAARTAYSAENLLVTLDGDQAGAIGRGECAPVTYVTGETVSSVQAALESTAPLFIDQPVDRLQPLLEKAAEALPHAPAARAGLEMAIFDLWARFWQIPLWHYFGASQRRIQSDLTIPIVDSETAKGLAAEAWAIGFQHFKIKVGDPSGPDADLARIQAILQAAPQARLRIDANQAFTPAQAVAFAQVLADLGASIELLEQPVPKEDWQELAYIRQKISIPLFADESARDLASVLELLRANAVDGINVKIMKSGFVEALKIISLCRAAGKQLMLGCMLESPLGIAAAAQLAAGLGTFDYIDLDSHFLLQPIPGLSGGFVSSGGVLTVEDQKTGWGVEIQQRESRQEQTSLGTF